VALWASGPSGHARWRAAGRSVADPSSGDFYLPTGRVDLPAPRELAIEELPAIVESFGHATRNARQAGFDGVELHGANGYLQDQFLQDISNKRTDAYGGRIENRARLMLETAEAMIGAWDRDHVGVRLSPSTYLYGMDDRNKLETFSYVVRVLDALKIGVLTLLEPNAKDLARGVQIELLPVTWAKA
jgi:N-ethylmaleimide reductase